MGGTSGTVNAYRNLLVEERNKVSVPEPVRAKELPPMLSLACISLLSITVSRPGGVSTVGGAGSARTSVNTAFSYTVSAQKALQPNGTYKYLGSFAMQGYVGRDLVKISVPAWSSGVWSGNQANLVAWATVTVNHAGVPTVYHGVARLQFVDNNHGQNSTASNPPPCDCVCLSWKDKYSPLAYNLLGVVQRGGSVTVR